MEGTQETPPKKSGLTDRIRERMWKVISRDSLSIKIAKQWEAVARAAGYIDPSRIEAIGKTAAIGANALNIIIGVTSGVLGGHDIWKAKKRMRTDDWTENATQYPYASNVATKGALEIVAAPVILGFRPVAWATLLAGMAGKPIVERVYTITHRMTHPSYASV